MDCRRVVTLASFGVALVCFVLARAGRRAADVPLSPLIAGRYVGADWVERAGVGTDERPVGEMDDFTRLARPDFDPGRVDDEVRRFYERTSEYDLQYRVRWERGFRLGAALATRLTSRIEQLNLPAPGEHGETGLPESETGGRWRRLRSRFVGVDPAADPREEARVWTRTDPDTDEAVFVAVYGAHDRDGERFVNIAVPLPGTNLSTVLRVEHDDRPGGVRLTTSGNGRDDDPGLYLLTPAGAVSLPMEQRFRVWPTGKGVTESLRATHEMWLLGRRFLAVEYRIDRRAE
ncbi:hypothetical protein ACFO0N_08715 [Halobium salinum]|uniref:DUF3108 domain-containing protein n=1 Tax=Halobium salinum TaxID=1364940 RepID=A0ABD5PAT6_9EURY|nr:hypothetical protein [Halobium salinum]